MGASQESNYALSKPFPSLKIIAVEQTLTRAVVNFRDLVLEFEQMHLENKQYKQMFLTQKEKLESQPCSNCEKSEKVISTRDLILNSIVTELNKLLQTKDFNIIDRLLKQISGEILTPLESNPPQNKTTKHKDNENFIPPKEISPEKKLEEANIKIEDVVCKEESISEIEGTPTGRKSPIVQSRKTKSNSGSLSLKDKKKCPESWPTPENKTIILSYPSPTRSKSGGRLRQGRLNLVRLKSSNVVDLTCSPEHSGGGTDSENHLACNVKKELIDNEETILPSPTSGPVKYPPLYKTMGKDSPKKFIKTMITSKFKIEADTSDNNVKSKLLMDENGKEIEDSINLFNQFPNRFKSPMKREQVAEETHCGDDSVSLLQNIRKNGVKNSKLVNSPSKRPLTENVNITNTENHENETSMSILHKEPIVNKAVKMDEELKRAKATVAPVYKEPAVRKKAEKRALPGWSCDECKNFYDELYKDNPEMLAKKMDECSKHRGRNNPVRPKTPEGFWNPRWDVPDNTEEFNRRNNAV